MTRRSITPSCYIVEARTRQEWAETPESSEVPDFIFDSPVRDRIGNRLGYIRCGFQGLGAVPFCVPDARLICASFTEYYLALTAAVHPRGYQLDGQLMSRVHCKSVF